MGAPVQCIHGIIPSSKSSGLSLSGRFFHIYYTLIALHRCDSSQHILLRPRKYTWDHIFPSAVSPCPDDSFPRHRHLLLMNPAPLSSKFFIHIILFITYVKKSQSFFLYFIVTFLPLYKFMKTFTKVFIKIFTSAFTGAFR